MSSDSVLLKAVALFATSLCFSALQEGGTIFLLAVKKKKIYCAMSVMLIAIYKDNSGSSLNNFKYLG